MRRSKALRRTRIREEMGLDQPPSKPRWYERNWFKAIELAAIVTGVIGVIVGVVAFQDEVYQRETVDRPVAEATLAELRASEAVRARADLQDPTRGIGIKVEALNTLVRLDHNIDFLDFYCDALYGTENLNRRNHCRARTPHVRNVTLSAPDGRLFRRLDFSGVELHVARLSNIECRACNFEGSTIAGEFTNSRFFASNFQNASLYPLDASGVDFGFSNMSGARLRVEYLEQADFGHAWYWRGEPPIFYTRDGDELTIADLGSRVDATGLRACDKTAAGGQPLTWAQSLTSCFDRPDIPVQVTRRVQP